MPYSSVQIPSETLIRHILDKANPKYRLIILLMSDLGLRVIEVIGLRLFQLEVPAKTLTLEGQPDRVLPLNERLYTALVRYWGQLSSHDPMDYLFPPAEQSEQLHLSRNSVYRRIVSYSNGLVTPSQLSAYFVYKLQRNNVERTFTQGRLHSKAPSSSPSSLLKSYEPTTPQRRTRKRDVLFNQFMGWFRQAPSVAIMPMEMGLTHFHIGRKAEIEWLTELSQKQVNLLITGTMGIGKSHLLDNFNIGKIIRVDDFRYPKNVLGGILLELFNNDKDAILEKLVEVKDYKALEKIATKESSKRLCRLAIEVTQPKEYTLIIDDLTDITKVGVRILEKLKNHFHIIAAARQFKLEHATCISNFEKLELKPLNRLEALELIDQISSPLLTRIKDREAYRNRIWEQTSGVPLFIIEMVERLSKEAVIDAMALSSIRHTAARAEIDFSVPLIIAFSSLLVLRYLGSELGHNAGAFRLLGGIALVIAFFSRRIFKALRKKYV